MKTIFTIDVANLIAVGARFTPAGDRATNGVDVHLSDAGGGLLLKCRQFTDSTDRTFVVCESFSPAFTEAVKRQLDHFKVDNVKSESHGLMIRVKVLDLLDTHWMLFQLVGEPVLKITAPDGYEHYLQFQNDGENLWAEFDATGHNVVDGSQLLNNLKAMHTPYETL